MKSSLTKLFVCSQLIVFLLLVSAPGHSFAGDVIFNGLQKSLAGMGFGKKELAGYFKEPGLKFEARAMARFLSVSESKLNYKQFLSKKTVGLARKFVVRHKVKLLENQVRTGVPGSVVVAILSVETRLGSYTGKWRVFNMLASQAVLDTPEAIKRMKDFWPKKQIPTLSKKSFRQRLARRADWAREELAMLFRLAKKAKKSPHDYKGSVTGAMGMGQFIPSSAKRFGSDGDKDGVVDLSQPADAIRSVGMFLKGHGWKPGMSRKQAEKVVWAYNHSKPYVRTVLDLAKRIESGR